MTDTRMKNTKVHAKAPRKWRTVGERWPLFEDYRVNGIRWGYGKAVTCKRCLKLVEQTQQERTDANMD